MKKNRSDLVCRLSPYTPYYWVTGLPAGWLNGANKALLKTAEISWPLQLLYKQFGVLQAMYGDTALFSVGIS